MDRTRRREAVGFNEWRKLSCTRDVILRLGIHETPWWRPYHSSVTLLCSREDGSRPGERWWRGAPDSTEHSVMETTPTRGQQRSDGRKATQRPFSKRGSPGKPAHSGKGPASYSRIPSDLQRLSQEDFPQTQQRLEVLFGVAPCLLALTQGRRRARRLFVKETSAPQRAAVQQVCEEAQRQRVRIQLVSKKELDKLCEGRVHQGLCLEASPLDYLREEDTAGTHGDSAETPLWLVLDGVQDPMNLGAILRSAYFLGADRIISSIHNSCPLTPVVSKASSGVMEVMGVYGCDSLPDMLKVKVRQGWQVVGTVGVAEVDTDVPVLRCSDFQLTKPTLLLIGGEGDGLSLELRRLCQALLTILPSRELHPGVESLNVSVATGILLHTLLSSRRPARR
ncbi:rRNA methyltransferase 1, mitochondrial isoform X2 [Megalops cyprinoides]|uniref:rRNA methyltransferase 1, mitochondrial isoform X2 n=1 Tax=Megalops cyprinoides TaxID=118141 RepID=UPI0018644562|nr:rRNA methyltransferase 1, mitochondrial isoform X2 [Megalops cyprinoides]